MAVPGPWSDLRKAYRLRWKRREIRLRAIRARKQLSTVKDRTGKIAPNDILAFCCLRNELDRLPAYLAHYRGLGVRHFCVVDNGSDDGGTEFLRAQDDVSLWLTEHSYHASHFGMDWVNWLLLRYGSGHWCLTVDADELLIYPHWQERDLGALTAHLDHIDLPGFGAMMLDLYPRDRLDTTPQVEDPNTSLPSGLGDLMWFDKGPYRLHVHQPKLNRQLQGGVRERVFFSETPERSPTLNKIPLVRWNWRYVYVNSTHSAFPRSLNTLYDGPDDQRLSGVLLHTKFKEGIAARSEEELSRQQHFIDPSAYQDYHRAIIERPRLWDDASERLRDWQQLVDLGLMGAGDWGKQEP